MNTPEDQIRESLRELSDATPVRSRPALERARSPHARRWPALAAAALLLFGTSIAMWRLWPESTPQLRSTTTSDPQVVDPASSPLATPPLIARSPSSTSPIEPSTAGSASSVDTTVQTAIIRPYINPSACADGSKAIYNAQPAVSPYFPFAQSEEAPIPIQIIASPSRSYAGSYAVVLRYFATDNIRSDGDAFDINGATVHLATVGNGNGNGNGHATWNLPDGSTAYMRTRGLDRDAIVAIVGGLMPRDRTAALPGFDYLPAAATAGFSLVAEGLNTDTNTGQSTRFTCSTPNGNIYRVDAVSGDPLFVYLGIIDRAPPLAVADNGDGALLISGRASPTAPAISDVVDAPPTLWDSLPTSDGSDPSAVPTNPSVPPPDEATTTSVSGAPTEGDAEYFQPCTAVDGTPLPGPLPGTTLTLLTASSPTGPIIGINDTSGDYMTNAIIGLVAMSGDGSTLAATIDRRGPDDITVSADGGATWNTIGTVLDATHLTINASGSQLAVSTTSTGGRDEIILFNPAAGTNRVLPLDDGPGAVDALTFTDTTHIAAALEDGIPGEFARPGRIWNLDLTTDRWTAAPTGDNPQTQIITSVIATASTVSYLAVGAGSTPPAAYTQMNTITGDGQVQIRDFTLPQLPILLGDLGAAALIAVADDSGNYHVVRRGGGDQILSLGCIRPGPALNLNTDPDKH